MSVRSLPLTLGLSLVFAACSGNEVQRPLPDAGQAVTDAGSTVTDAGASTPDAGAVDVCGLPIETGPCLAAMRRYAFDPSAGECVEFTYGGCGGNENNFETAEACAAACGGSVEPVSCGGWSGPTCTADQFCDFSWYGCDWADGSGVCTERPEDCDTEYAPVCGCDGKTYANECSAHAAGTDAAAPGACERSCEDTRRDSIIVGGHNTFGLCASKCVANLSIFESELDVVGACDVVTLEICDHGDVNCRTSRGTLTAAGHDQVRAAAEALEGVTLDPVYGCPDCADGGETLIRLRRQGVVTEHAYDYSRGAPEGLERAGGLLQTIIDGMATCTANQYVEPTSDCVPR